MEERLREQAALVRLGEMAAVIAHEVKNPLAAVRGAIQVIGKRLASGSREATVVTDIIARIDTLNNLVRDLLLFARPPQPHPLPGSRLSPGMAVSGRFSGGSFQLAAGGRQTRPADRRLCGHGASGKA